MRAFGESADPKAGKRWAREVATVVDPLLADVWAFAWSSEESEEREPALALLLRMAYLQGYGDALEEERRGELLHRLGVQVPPVKKRPRPSNRGSRAKGSPRSSGT